MAAACALGVAFVPSVAEFDVDVDQSLTITATITGGDVSLGCVVQVYHGTDQQACTTLEVGANIRVVSHTIPQVDVLDAGHYSFSVLSNAGGTASTDWLFVNVVVEPCDRDALSATRKYYLDVCDIEPRVRTVFDAHNHVFDFPDLRLMLIVPLYYTRNEKDVVYMRDYSVPGTTKGMPFVKPASALDLLLEVVQFKSCFHRLDFTRASFPVLLAACSRLSIHAEQATTKDEQDRAREPIIRRLHAHFGGVGDAAAVQSKDVIDAGVPEKFRKRNVEDRLAANETLVIVHATKKRTPALPPQKADSSLLMASDGVDGIARSVATPVGNDPSASASASASVVPAQPRPKPLLARMPTEASSALFSAMIAGTMTLADATVRQLQGQVVDWSLVSKNAAKDAAVGAGVGCATAFGVKQLQALAEGGNEAAKAVLGSSLQLNVAVTVAFFGVAAILQLVSYGRGKIDKHTMTRNLASLATSTVVGAATTLGVVTAGAKIGAMAGIVFGPAGVIVGGIAASLGGALVGAYCARNVEQRLYDYQTSAELTNEALVVLGISQNGWQHQKTAIDGRFRKISLVVHPDKVLMDDSPADVAHFFQVVKAAHTHLSNAINVVNVN